MQTLIQDLRYGLRMQRRSPGFSAVALLSLALGIGANTTIFSLANAFLLRPLPVEEPSRVVRIYSNRFSNTSYPNYVDYRDRNQTLAGLAAFQMTSLSLRNDGEAEHIFGQIASGNYFTVLGVRPALGRTFLPEDDRTPLTVLSHGFWQRRFASDTGVIGKAVTLNGQSFTVVGVAPPGFTGTLAPLVADLWVPLMTDPLLRPGTDRLTNRGGGAVAST